jgi:DNA-binding IclR family transcriptional regulator
VTGLGKIMLANANRDIPSDAPGQPLHALTQYSLSTTEQLDAELKRTRDRGVAIDRQETVVGIGCVAASIGPVDHFYGNRSAISLCGPIQDMNFAQLGGVARVAAREIWDACVANDLRHKGSVSPSPH